MASQLRNVLRFTNLVVGVPTAQAHNLNYSGVAAIPDEYYPNAPGFTVAVDAVNVTVTRTTTATTGTVDVIVKYWHTFDRVFGAHGASQPAALANSPFTMPPGVVGGGFDPARTIVVAQSGGDVASVAAGIAAASALVPAPSVANPAIVWVFPGEYTEVPLTVPTGVALWGYGAAATTILAANNAAPLVTLLARSEINGLTLRGAGAAGGVGLLAAGAGTAYGRAVVVHDCTVGVRATGVGVTLFLALCEMHRAVGETMNIAAEAAAGARLELINPHVEGTAGLIINIGLQANGAGSELHAYGLDVSYTESAIVATATGLLHAIGGFAHESTYAFRTTATGGTLHAVSVDTENITTYGLLMDALANSAFRGSGNTIRSDQISVPDGADVLSSQMSDFAGDDSQMVLGELQVGLPETPTESVFGEGDSHVRGMSVFRNTNQEAGVWSDITTEMASATGSTAAAFPGTGINNCLYVGGNREFPGVKIRTTAAIVLGAGTLVWEYWDGVVWSTFRLMTADQALPYASYAEDTFGRVNFEQVRFNTADIVGWATKALNGTTKYWVRCRITGAITTVPTLEQIKLHTNRYEINADGYTERFGTGIVQRIVPWHLNLLDNFVGGGAPGNQNLALTANITINGQGNVFANNALEGMGGIFTVPDGLDTSRPVTLRWNWIPLVGGAGAAVEFEGHFGQVELGDIINGTVVDTAWNVIVNTNLIAQNQLTQTTTDFNVSDLVPGELIAFSLSRDAQAGNPHDTLNGNIALVTVELLGWFWR